MAEMREKIEAELENIERALGELPSTTEGLSTLELAGVGALLHSFYNGIENVLVQLLRGRNIEPPHGPSWHRDLVDMTVSQGLVTQTTADDLRQYVAFRHFFNHAYAIDIRSELVEPLMHGVRRVYALFRHDIGRDLPPP
jgi:uncharacterized protein YutE (UPF0331/DUF86 family)